MCSKCLENIETTRNFRNLILDSDKFWKISNGKVSEKQIKLELKEETTEVPDHFAEEDFIEEYLKEEVSNDPPDHSDFEWPANNVPAKNIPPKNKKRLKKLTDKEKTMCTICGFLLTKKSISHHEKLHQVAVEPKIKVKQFFYCDFCGNRFVGKFTLIFSRY